jgi:hypothetical protein
VRINNHHVLAEIQFALFLRDRMAIFVELHVGGGNGKGSLPVSAARTIVHGQLQHSKIVHR